MLRVALCRIALQFAVGGQAGVGRVVVVGRFIFAEKGEESHLDSLSDEQASAWYGWLAQKKHAAACFFREAYGSVAVQFLFQLAALLRFER
ncbi:hypothetical protein GCM10007386_22410 [Pseudoduganella dura]|nr:hypothetical protein GCM10007386_22410 [Pseudoduganella dura]